MHYIALDMGSTTIKRALLDTVAMTAKTDGVAPFPPSIQPAPAYEADAEALLSLCKGLIDEGLDAHPDARGILISAQMHGCVVTSADGAPITGYISWRDGLCGQPAPEGGAYLDALAAMLPPNASQLTGMALKPKLALCSLYARARRGLEFPRGALFHTLGGYLIHRLSGAHACHLTAAAATGLCDVTAGTWSRTLIEAAGLGHLRFPTIVSGIEPPGTYSHNGVSYPLYPDIGDHQACTLGAHANPLTDIIINIGTGGMAGRITDSFTDRMECRPFFDDQFVETLTGLPNGRHVQAFVDLLSDAASLTGSARSKDALWAYITDTNRIRPDMESGFSAHFGAGDTLALEHIAMAGGVANVTAALYRAVAERCAEAVKALGSGERLIFTGGAVERNPALRAFIQKACGMPGVKRSGDAVMNGLLALATGAG